MDKDGNVICYPFGDFMAEAQISSRIADVANATAGMQDPAAKIEMLKLAQSRALDAADVLQNVEEERDELRRDVSALLNALPNGAHDVTEGVVSIRAMRAAIVEAHEALEAVSRLPVASMYPDGPCLEKSDMDEVKAALAKLKPFMP